MKQFVYRIISALICLFIFAGSFSCYEIYGDDESIDETETVEISETSLEESDEKPEEEIEEEIIEIDDQLEELVEADEEEIDLSNDEYQIEELVQIDHITPSECTVAINNNVSYNAIGTNNQNINNNVLWFSDNEMVATINADGLLSGKQGGSTRIVAIDKSVDITQINNDINNLTGNYNNLYIQLDQLENQLETALDDLEAKTSLFSKADKNARSANRNVNKAIAERDDLNKQLRSAKNNLSDAEKAIDKANNEIITAQEDLVKAADIKNNVNQYKKQGSVGFFYFHSGKDSAAASIILERIKDQSNKDDPWYKWGKIKLNSAGDATTIKNMKLAVTYIKECNSLRASDNHNKGINKEPLMINDVMMAISQIQTTASSVFVYENYVGHSGMFNVGENLAWGYTGAAYSDRSPFRGWYDAEKISYEQKDIQSAGHYLNIANPDNAYNRQYVTTGAAVVKRSDTVLGIAHGQVFFSSYLDEYGYKSYTPEEYLADLEFYENVLNNPTKAINDLNQSIEDNRAKIATLESKITEYNLQIAELNELVAEKNQYIVELKEILNQANNALEIARNNKNQSQNIYDNLKAQYEQLSNTLQENQEELNIYLDQRASLGKCATINVVEKITSLQLKDIEELRCGKQKQIRHKILPKTADNQTLIWVSSDEEIATVDDHGVVTGLAQGQVTITAYTTDDSNIETTCIVNVIHSLDEPILKSIFNVKNGIDVRFGHVDGATSYEFIRISNGKETTVANVNVEDIPVKYGYLNWTDKEVKTEYGKGFAYKVIAHDGSIESDISDQLAIFRLNEPTITKLEPTSNSIKVTWNKEKVHRYVLQYSSDGENWTTIETTATNRNITGLKSNTTYYFRVRGAMVQKDGTIHYSQYSTRKSAKTK